MSEDKVEKKEPLSVPRMIVAGIGAMLMALSGGCTLLFGVPAFVSGGEESQILILAIIFGGIPFAIGLLMFHLATKRPSRDETESQV